MIPNSVLQYITRDFYLDVYTILNRIYLTIWIICATSRSWLVIFHFDLSTNQYAQASSPYQFHVLLGASQLSSKLIKQGYLVESLKLSFNKFYRRYEDFINQSEVSLKNVKWHSDSRTLTATSQPIWSWFVINFMTLIMSVSTKAWPHRISFIKHLKWVWYDSKERLPFRTHGFVRLKTRICSSCWDQFFRTCFFFLNISPWISLVTFPHFILKNIYFQCI